MFESIELKLGDGTDLNLFENIRGEIGFSQSPALGKQRFEEMQRTEKFRNLQLFLATQQKSDQVMVSILEEILTGQLVLLE